MVRTRGRQNDLMSLNIFPDAKNTQWDLHTGSSAHNCACGLVILKDGINTNQLEALEIAIFITILFKSKYQISYRVKYYNRSK